MSDRHPFSERRYSDSELARILDEASRSEARAELPAASEGFTLEEIRDIAREAGIDPSHVDRAAAGLVASQGSLPATNPQGLRVWRFLSADLSRTVHEEIVLPRALTDEEMISLVHLLESVVPWAGVVRQAGSWVEWRDVKDRLYMGIVRGKDQTRIRLIADLGAELKVGAKVIAAATMLATGALGGFPALLPVGAVGIGAAGVFWTSRTRKTRAHLRELLEILSRV
jgi:hypothetical protein